MGSKNQFNAQLNWQTTSPVTGFLPRPANQSGSTPSGTLTGTMTSTSSIYSQIFEKSRLDNAGIELTWTGTPTGTITVQCSNSGVSFYSLTFSPALIQPSGSASGYLINLNQLPFKYFFVKYINSSGSGSLSGYLQMGDVN